ncbi:Predicted small periplasmic lipoprotein [Kingella potus]|uniref:Predicted small periplasmic lipoprotein n=1 Tax=Kingella potus TaxID=265175 RepID=A0A377R0B1_9NEIS|nr:lipoprotein [Kingella potus]UOP00796.1 lipoprotein [Kingella potus]STR00435.1 Predicted small periplasmic lipoprotein [Kingella potus]
MKTPVCFLAAALLLSACGFKGGLYLPKEQDKAGFGAVQTGLKKSARKPEKTADAPEEAQPAEARP